MRLRTALRMWKSLCQSVMEEELSQLSGKEALEPARALLATSLDSPALIQGLAASSEALGRKHVPLGPNSFRQNTWPQLDSLKLCLEKLLCGESINNPGAFGSSKRAQKQVRSSCALSLNSGKLSRKQTALWRVRNIRMESTK